MRIFLKFLNKSDYVIVGGLLITLYSAVQNSKSGLRILLNPTMRSKIIHLFDTIDPAGSGAQDPPLAILRPKYKVASDR